MSDIHGAAARQEQLSRAMTLQLAGAAGDAARLYDEILREAPEDPAANYCMGMLHVQACRPLEALPRLLAALQTEPENPDYWLGYLEGLLAASRLDEAAAALLLGRRHGLDGAAVEGFAARLEAAVGEHGERTLLAAVARGETVEAEAAAATLTTRFPTRGVSWKVSGALLWARGARDAALAAMRRAVQLLPQDPEAHCNLGVALGQLERHDEAGVCLARAIEIDPRFATGHFRLGMNLAQCGEPAAAAASLRRGLSIGTEYTPGDAAENHSNLLFVSAHDPELSAERLYAEHRGYGEYFEAVLRGACPEQGGGDAGKRLAVGFLSGDLYCHSVSNFLEPILAHLHGRPGLELHAYYNNVIEDAVSRRLHTRFDRWSVVDKMTDEALAARIRADGIDVLIDLSGHTGHNRLPVFARKPAPVQVSWLGYPGTTGLTAMDYYLADPHWLPPGRYDALFTERLVYLPDRWAFVPHPDSPQVTPLPALATGRLTFASFHRLGKINSATVRLWAELLRAVPNATLQVIGIPLDGQQHRLLESFAACGVEAERITCHPRSTMDVYLSMHHHVDIALDTLAYSGATTTMHSLSMGVPTLTLAGHTSQARACAGILEHLGLDSFIAADTAQFIAHARYWAAHLPELARLREGLRERLARSPSGHPELIADHFESALRRMWSRRCSALPAASFSTAAADLEGTKNDLLAGLDEIGRWLEYLEALLAAGRLDTARNILSLARRDFAGHGALQEFARRLAARQQRTRRADAAVADPETPPRVQAPSGRTGSPPARSARARTARVQERRLLALVDRRRFTDVLALARTLTEQHPERGLGWKMLGAFMSAEGGLDEAIEIMRKAVSLLPQDAEAHVNLGVSLAKAKRFAEAERYLLHAIQLQPRLPAAHYRLALAYEAQGRYAEGEASLRRGRALGTDVGGSGPVTLIAGDDELSYSHLLFLAAHNPELSAERLYAEHRGYGEYFEAVLRGACPEQGGGDAGKRLAVGFLSGDLYCHSVSNFLEPILAHLHGRPGLELHAYYNNVIEDAVSRRLHTRFDRWSVVDKMTDEALAARIRADGIDVLIDLSGHTGHNRLPVFARKPAPVQVSWLGYPGTTGLTAMDYYLADPHWLPPGRYDALFTERLVYLPDRWAFVPHPDSPQVTPLPALATGRLTFASFHRLGKINSATVRLWAELLRAVPNATLQVIGIPLDGQQHRLLESFAACGVEAERITCHPRSTMDVYLSMHHHVDIALDTLAYSGATTTMHSLSMGVPTLTLAGHTSQARACAGILEHLGLDSFIAADTAQFIAHARYWAAHLPELARLREGLRERLARSPSGHPELIADHFESALRRMWSRRCSALPAASFSS